MKFGLVLSTLAVVAASAEAFAPAPSSSSSTRLQAEIGETGVAFENVAREWRCKVRICLSVLLLSQSFCCCCCCCCFCFFWLVGEICSLRISAPRLTNLPPSISFDRRFFGTPEIAPVAMYNPVNVIRSRTKTDHRCFQQKHRIRYPPLTHKNTHTQPRPPSESARRRTFFSKCLRNNPSCITQQSFPRSTTHHHHAPVSEQRTAHSRLRSNDESAPAATTTSTMTTTTMTFTTTTTTTTTVLPGPVRRTG